MSGVVKYEIMIVLNEEFTDKMKKIEDRLQEKIDKLFPSERYTVTMTGKAYVFEKGTHYLVKNLVLSLLFAIVLISSNLIR